MAWGRLDADAPNHPKFIQAGPLAFGFFCAGLCYANKYRTDGFIPTKAIFTILPGLRHRACVAESVKLVEAGLWEVRPDGYQIHDFLKYNLSAADQREQDRINYERRVAGGRARSQTANRIRGRFIQQDHQQLTSPPAGTSEPASTSLRNVTVRTEEEGTALSSNGSTPHPNAALREQARQIIGWLNTKAGRNFPTNETNLKLVMARLREGVADWQLRAIVSIKTDAWKGDPKMNEFLRPKTLFNATNVSNYLGDLPAGATP